MKITGTLSSAFVTQRSGGSIHLLQLTSLLIDSCRSTDALERLLARRIAGTLVLLAYHSRPHSKSECAISGSPSIEPSRI